MPYLTQEELVNPFAARLEEILIGTCAANGLFTGWCPAIQRQLGYSIGELVGKGLESLDPEANRAATQEELREADARGEYTKRRKLRRKDGSVITTEVSTVPLKDAQAATIGYVRIIRGIASTNALALTEALDRSNILIRDLDGTIEHWTSGCERLYGWSASEAQGRNMKELLQTTFPKPLEEIQQELKDKGNWQGELVKRHKDGRLLLISSDWVMVADEANARPRIISTDTDITSRLEMQRELEASNERFRRVAAELERSNQELEEFARIASHDLSAPITTARWLTDLLTARHSQQLDADGLTCVKQISASLERMSDLIDAILAHALAGKNAVSAAEETDANAALDAAIENLRRDIATTGAVVEREPLPKLLIQPQPLTQLFQNLLSNAIKYRRPGVALRIEVSAARQGEFWTIEVRDNGSGIERDWFERIFLPLQRGHGGNVKGSGIGLATCRKIVSRAGGEIWVESEVGEGSAFYFTLPAAIEFK